jgi:hypothetical protein
VVNFLLKMFLYPGILFTIDALSPAINYSGVWYTLLTGMLIGATGYMMDMVLLVCIGAEASSVIETVAAVVIVYFSQFFVSGESTNFFGALLAGILLGLSGYLTRRLILGDGYREKKGNNL